MATHKKHKHTATFAAQQHLLDNGANLRKCFFIIFVKKIYYNDTVLLIIQRTLARNKVITANRSEDGLQSSQTAYKSVFPQK